MYNVFALILLYCKIVKVHKIITTILLQHLNIADCMRLPNPGRHSDSHFLYIAHEFLSTIYVGYQNHLEKQTVMTVIDSF